MNSERFLTLLMLALLLGCTKKQPFEVPPLSDVPITEHVTYGDLADEVPAYGVVPGVGNQSLTVNIEAEDSAKVVQGQRSIAYRLPSSEPIPCRVVQVLKGASGETGQAIAWLASTGPKLKTGDFYYALIRVGERKHVLTIPREAVFIRDGRTFALRKEKEKFGAVPVETGIVGKDRIEVTKGLSAGDEIVVHAGLGLLYPDFKASEDD